MSPSAASPALLEEAIAAARRGERSTAKDKLTRYLRHDQKNEQAWLWMSSVVESDRERVFCLNNVLKLNPNNITAKRGLALLGALPPEMRAELGIHVVGVNFEEQAKDKSRRRGYSFRRSRRLEYAIIGLLALIILAIGGLFTVNFFMNRARQNANTIQPSAVALSASNTPLPTGTPMPSPTSVVRTATPLFEANQTPLAFLLGLPQFTPTPPGFILPFFPEEAHARGERQYNAGDYDSAIQSFQQAIGDNANNYSAHYYLGQIYLQKGDYNRAFGSFTNALKINSTFAPAHLGHGLANFSLGGNPLNDYNKATTADPDWVDPYIYRAAFYASRRNTTAAIAELETARALAPDNVIVFWNLAEQYLAAGEYGNAHAALSAGFDIDPTVLDLYRVQAKLALVEGDYSTAQEALNIYTAYAPANAEGWTLAGQAYLGLGQFGAAIEALDRAITLGPDDPRDAYIARGQAHLQRGDATSAEDDFDAALRLGVTTRYRLQIGQAYFGAGDYDTAFAEFQRAVESDSTLFETHYWLGVTYLQLDFAADAIISLTKAFDRAGDDTQKFDALYQRALANNALGNSDKAALDLQAALAYNLADGTRLDAQADAADLLQQLGATPLPTHTPRP